MGMWWEILPTMMIIAGISCVPFVRFGILHKLQLGSPPLRDVRKDINKNMYFRDKSHSYKKFLTTRFYSEGVADGSPYYSYGLEKYSDKE